MIATKTTTTTTTTTTTKSQGFSPVLLAMPPPLVTGYYWRIMTVTGELSANSARPLRLR